jgi:hypothetical protein
MKFTKNLFLISMVIFAMASCSAYGTKTTKGPVEVYYKEGISAGEAQQTANLLYIIDSSANNNTTATKSYQLCKKRDTVCFRMVADRSKLKGIDDNSFFIIGNMISDSIFNHAPLNVELTNNTFETFKTFTYKKVNFENL